MSAKHGHTLDITWNRHTILGVRLDDSFVDDSFVDGSFVDGDRPHGGPTLSRRSQRRHPAKTPLDRVISENLERWLEWRNHSELRHTLGL